MVCMYHSIPEGSHRWRSYSEMISKGEQGTGRHVLNILSFRFSFLSRSSPLVFLRFVSWDLKIAIKQTVHTGRPNIRRVPATLDRVRYDLPTEKEPSLSRGGGSGGSGGYGKNS